jgi:hypothetical protein
MEMSKATRKYLGKLGKLGAAARALKLSPERRKEIAKQAAAVRWAGRKHRRNRASE